MSSREFHKGFQPVSEPSGVPEPGIVKGGGYPRLETVHVHRRIAPAPGILNLPVHAP